MTHLPQIACFADRHVRVTKRKGVAALEVVEAEDRVAEVARMLSGSAESGTATSHARELLEQAERERDGFTASRAEPGAAGASMGRAGGDVRTAKGTARAGR